MMLPHVLEVLYTVLVVLMRAPLALAWMPGPKVTRSMDEHSRLCCVVPPQCTACSSCLLACGVRQGSSARLQPAVCVQT